MKEKKGKKRWLLLLLLLPLSLLAKAAIGAWKAFRGEEERFVSADREVPPAAPYHREHRVVQVGSGIPITATVFIPSGKGPFPAVIMVHSWMWWRIQCDLLYAPSFARRGYVVLTYDCRGWGSSGGEVACAAPDREMVDLEDMITWLASPESGVPVDPEKIGITGVSYGGGHSFLIATRDERIKAAAPMNGWTDLYYSLMPNGAWKWIWSLVLFVGSIWALKFDTKNDLVRWLRAVLVDRDLGAIEGELKERSAIYGVDKVKCPMFIVHSWNDDLFEPNQILHFYEKLDVPKKLHIANGIHGFDAGRGDFLIPNEIWDDARRWFDYWLKDEKDNGVEEEPSVKYYRPWDRSMVTAGSWPPEEVGERLFYLRGEHPASVNSGSLREEEPPDHEPAELIVNNTVSNLHSSGPSVLRPNVIDKLPVPGVPFSIPGDSVSFTTEPINGGMEIVGAPRVSLSVSSSSEECQLNALLYDVAESGFPKLVTHNAMMVTDAEPGVIDRLEFELIACSHLFPDGHRARLVICASDPMYVFPSRIPSYYRVFHTADHPSSLSLPVMGTAGE